MQALDTNILVRFLVKDDEKQADAVFSLFKKAEWHREKLFVSLIVLLELIWVLDSLYKVPRDKLLCAISTLLMLPKSLVAQSSKTELKCWVSFSPSQRSQLNL